MFIYIYNIMDNDIIYVYIYIYIYIYIHQEEESFSRLASYKHHDLQPRINYPHFAWPTWRIVFQVGIN